MTTHNKPKPICNTCNKRILQHKSCINCNICSAIFHPKCQDLKRDEIKLLEELEFLSTWICTLCMENILPVFYHINTKNTGNIDHGPSRRQNCFCCNKLGNRNGMADCDLCGNLSHSRCFSGPMGCRRCVQDMFPGFNIDTSELFFCETQARYNDKLFNPFDRNSDINNIGNIDDESSSFEELAWSPLHVAIYLNSVSIMN